MGQMSRPPMQTAQMLPFEQSYQSIRLTAVPPILPDKESSSLKSKIHRHESKDIPLMSMISISFLLPRCTTFQALLRRTRESVEPNSGNPQSHKPSCPIRIRG
jgi:hypothetical protein